MIRNAFIQGFACLLLGLSLNWVAAADGALLASPAKQAAAPFPCERGQKAESSASSSSSSSSSTTSHHSSVPSVQTLVFCSADSNPARQRGAGSAAPAAPDGGTDKAKEPQKAEASSVKLELGKVKLEVAGPSFWAVCVLLLAALGVLYVIAKYFAKEGDAASKLIMLVIAAIIVGGLAWGGLKIYSYNDAAERCEQTLNAKLRADGEIRNHLLGQVNEDQKQQLAKLQDQVDDLGHQLQATRQEKVATPPAANDTGKGREEVYQDPAWALVGGAAILVIYLLGQNALKILRESVRLKRWSLEQKGDPRLERLTVALERTLLEFDAHVTDDFVERVRKELLKSYRNPEQGDSA